MYMYNCIKLHYFGHILKYASRESIEFKLIMWSMELKLKQMLSQFWKFWWSKKCIVFSGVDHDFKIKKKSSFTVKNFLVYSSLASSVNVNHGSI